MLEHLNQVPSLPPRTVVLGAAGFVGGALVKRLTEKGATTLALTRRDVDLMAPDAAERIASLLRPNDTFVAVAAKAPCKNVQMLADNIRMTAAIVNALALAQVAHVVNVSSDAVYADGPLPITEETPRAPTSLHGVMHLAREIAFLAEVKAPLAIVRPSLLYGAADPHNGYGPNQFWRLASAGKDIVLFGEGEEQRDHIMIDDAAELVVRVLERRSVGTLNIATGTVTSFMDIAKLVTSTMPGRATIKSRPRSGPMPHNGYRPFDISACRSAFPDFRYRPLREGIAKMQGAAPR